MPNAGLPMRVEGRNIYLCSPEYMAQYARRLLWAGVKIVGGCCGTTPDHIKLIRSETRSLQPLQKKLAVTVEEPHVKAQALTPVPMAEKSKLGAKLAAGKFVAFVEILPPRGVDASREIAGAQLCAEARHRLHQRPRRPARQRPHERAGHLPADPAARRHRGRQPLLLPRPQHPGHSSRSCWARTAVGVRNLICITGDPPRMGAYPDATAVFDVDAIGLVNIVNNLNHGLDIGGNPMGSQTALLIGVGANPGALNMDEEIRRFEWKVEAGAEYVVTQPVFDLDLLEAFLKRIEHVKIPVICGIWPLTSFRNAEFMVNELRVPVPEMFMERMRRVDNAEKAREEGVAIAREMVAACPQDGAGRTIERAVRPLSDGARRCRGHWSRAKIGTDNTQDGNRPGRNRSAKSPSRKRWSEPPPPCAAARWWPSPPTRCTRWWPTRSTCAPSRRCFRPRGANRTARCPS